MFQSGAAIVRAYVMYRPFVLFGLLGVIFGVLGTVPFVRYLVLMAMDEHGNHIQSLLLGVMLLTGSLLSFAIGVVADLTRINRTLQEDALDMSKRRSYGIEPA